MDFRPMKEVIYFLDTPHIIHSFINHLYIHIIILLNIKNEYVYLFIELCEEKKDIVILMVKFISNYIQYFY